MLPLPPPMPALPPQPSPDADKAAWRAWARAARALLASQERSARVLDGLLAWPPFLDARAVLSYLAFGTEIDLAPLAAGREGDMLLPRSVGRPEPRLTLHRWEPGRLERHPFGMRQPARGSAEADPREVELVLLPGLCFDRGGHRLGYGQGYYDRLLPRLRPEVPRVAVTFDALVVDRLPWEAHDVRATHLATESGVRPAQRA